MKCKAKEVESKQAHCNQYADSSADLSLEVQKSYHLWLPRILFSTDARIRIALCYSQCTAIAITRKQNRHHKAQDRRKDVKTSEAVKIRYACENAPQTPAEMLHAK